MSYERQRFTISVSDTGKGIAQDELPRLFERFYQAQGCTGGTGIGLSLVKAYVDCTMARYTLRVSKARALLSSFLCPTRNQAMTPLKTQPRRLRLSTDSLTTPIRLPTSRQRSR